MLYLVAFFISPLAVLLTGKPFQAILNFFLYLLAWIGLFLPFAPGMLFWLLGFAHACVAINSRNTKRRNRAMINAMQAR